MNDHLFIFVYIYFIVLEILVLAQWFLVALTSFGIKHLNTNIFYFRVSAFRMIFKTYMQPPLPPHKNGSGSERNNKDHVHIWSLMSPGGPVPLLTFSSGDQEILFKESEQHKKRFSFFGVGGCWLIWIALPDKINNEFTLWEFRGVLFLFLLKDISKSVSVFIYY